MNLSPGNLLIASTELVNDFFAQSVVLLLQHSESGAAGIVLNKPSEISIDTIWPELAQDSIAPSALTINIGGPCEGPVVALHSSPELTEVAVLPGVALAVQAEAIKSLIQQSHQQVRLYSGYAGWSPGQLENEVERGGWYSTRATSELVFMDPFDVWRRACDKFGENILAPVTGKQLPPDPSLN